MSPLKRDVYKVYPITSMSNRTSYHSYTIL
jgi:hypothetical protein